MGLAVASWVSMCMEMVRSALGASGELPAESEVFLQNPYDCLQQASLQAPLPAPGPCSPPAFYSFTETLPASLK